MKLDGVEVKTYKNGSGNVCSATLFYAVYPTGSRPASPSFTAVSAGFYQNCSGGSFPSGGACSGNDQKWQTPGSGSVANIDLTAYSPGAYTLEIYFMVTGSATGGGCGSQSFDNNNNNSTNYTASFTIQSPLPVSLTAFSVKAVQQQVQVEWTTTSEQNNAFFDVERSADLKEFASVAHVAGRGTSSTRQTYYFTDETPLKGISYYRLTQVDTDGQINPLRIQSVIIRPNGELTIINQPATDQVVISGLEETALLEIMDLQGRPYLQKRANASTVTIKTASWPNNQYIVRITESVGVQTRKIIVLH